MELKFDLATEPAVKATIAVDTSTSIVYVTTHAQNWFGVIATLIIGVISVVISTCKTPPLCTVKSSWIEQPCPILCLLTVSRPKCHIPS
jgi:hypothetical protein